MSEQVETPLQTLKEKLNTSSEISDCLYIFKYEDNPFLAIQYTHKIAEVRCLPIEYVDSFESLYADEDSLFGDESISLKVCKCTKFECPQDFDLSTIKNAIIICESINIESPLVYKFPKLEDWQILAYMKSQCKGLDANEVKWLYGLTTSITKNNEHIYRLDNEMKKIKCFPVDQQDAIFKGLSSSNDYSDLSPLNIFNFTNAILKKDKMTIMNVLEDIESIDVEGTGLITILHKNFKQLIDIQMGKNVTAESLGLSPKQFKAIQYNCGKYTSLSLVKIFKFITELDYKLKSGQLELSNQRMIDYIVCTVLSL